MCIYVSNVSIFLYLICIILFYIIYVCVSLCVVIIEQLGPYMFAVRLIKVGRLVRRYRSDQPPLADGGLEFRDSGSESDDSGLGELIRIQSS